MSKRRKQPKPRPARPEGRSGEGRASGPPAPNPPDARPAVGTAEPRRWRCAWRRARPRPVRATGGLRTGGMPLLRTAGPPPPQGSVSASDGLLEGPLLENVANNLSPAARRRLRHARRDVLWRASSLARARCCGRVLQDLDAGARARLRDGVAGWAGLQHCASVWVCPVCASRILVHRALEMGAVPCCGAVVALCGLPLPAPRPDGAGLRSGYGAGPSASTGGWGRSPQ